MSVLVLVVVLFTLFAISAPIAWALGISSLITLLFFTGVPLTVVPQRLFTGVDTFALVAIPFFLLAGELMERAGITERLIELAEAIVGHIRGGLGGVSVVASMLFSAVSGSGIAATAAMGKMTIPAMLKRGYDPRYAAAIQASSGAMGIIIPPSIVMILYSVISQASVADLFLGGVLPGVLMALALLLVGYFMARARGFPTVERQPMREVPLRALRAVPALLMPVIILAGIMSGVVTATESAVLAVAYAVIYGVINRRLTVSTAISALLDAARATAVILLIVANAGVFAWVVTAERLPALVAQSLSGIAEQPLLVLFVCAAILFVAGMFLDTTAALIILVPVMMPLIISSGVNPVHFGVMAVLTLAIGLTTPPVGINLFVATGIARVDVARTSMTLIPFVLALVAVLAMQILFPSLTLMLPALFK